MSLLHIDSSILGANSVSRAISAAVVGRLRGTDENLIVVYRDLAATPVAHLSAAYLAAQAAGVQHDQMLQEDLSLGESVLDEFLAAETIVVGAPMYNFGVPSQLKAWIDRILVAGKTFHYTASGVEGLAGGKRVILALSRGGYYGPETVMVDCEHQESYLKAIFRFLGITDLQIIRAEGVAYGPEFREKSLQQALKEASEMRPLNLSDD